MTDKKEEWEIGYSREHRANPFQEAKTVNFEQPKTLVGQMLDNRFLIEKDLTEGGADAGGIGLVYLAKDMKLMGKETVVKILQQAVLKNLDVARKFQHEKEALIRLDHPNIVRILDSGHLSDGNPFMVMEYISGYSLRRKLRDSRALPLDYCAHIIESVGNALGAVHAQQILHRDIKPENIMLSPGEEGFERVRLIDFGIARVENSKLAPLTAVERAIGTILYMAPEQLEGKIEQTPAVDIYALAIVAYEMLTGELPFKPQSMIDMHIMQKEGVKTLPSVLRADLPKEAESILLSGLSYQPQERPQNARAFARDLTGALRSKTSQSEISSAALVELTKTVYYPPEKTQPSPVNQTLPSPMDKTHPSPTIPTGGIGSLKNTSEPNNEQFLPIESLPRAAAKTNHKWFLPVAVLGGFALLLLGTGIFFMAQSGYFKADTAVVNNANADPNNNNAGTARKLRYWLDVQKMRDGKKLDASFESSGREIFENGYQFRFNFAPPDDGYFYLFNEGKDESGKVNYNILYPVPLPGKDSPKSSKENTVQTDWNTFGGKAGTEKIWLIWTRNELDVLKDAVGEAFDQRGRVADPKKEDALRKFLSENNKNYATEVEKDQVKKRTVLNGEGDSIVYLIELEHK